MLEQLSWVTAVRSDALTPFFIGITQLGSVYFLVPFFAVLYWLWDRDTVLRLGVLTVSSLILNKVLKLFFMLPRPDEIVHLVTATGWGMPSGHGQLAVVAWGWFAIVAEKRWPKILAILLIVVISFSRVYLGVHTPMQVLVGNLVGAGLLLIGYLVFRFVGPLWGQWGEVPKATVLSVWILGLAALVPDITPPGTATSSRTLCVTAALVLIGLWWGALAERNRTDFRRREGPAMWLATFGIGITIYAGAFLLALLALDTYAITFPYLVFLIALILGITPTFIVPTVLDRIGLGRR